MTVAESAPSFTEPPVPLAPLEIKALVRHRDGYRCAECGMTAAKHIKRYGRNLDVHRLVPGSVYTVSGCVALCRKCHKKKPKSPKGANPGRGWVNNYLSMLRSHKKALYNALKECARLDRRSIRASFVIVIEQGLTRKGLWPPKLPLSWPPPEEDAP